MKRISKRSERCLLEIAPHECEIGYLESRLSSMSFDEAWSEFPLLDDLDLKGLITGVGDKVVLSDLNGEDERTMRIPATFALTEDGRRYIDDLRREGPLSVLRAVERAVAIAGGIAAVINLILYIIWR